MNDENPFSDLDVVGSPDQWKELYTPLAIEASEAFVKAPILLGDETEDVETLRNLLRTAVSFLLVPRFVANEAWKRLYHNILPRVKHNIQRVVREKEPLAPVYVMSLLKGVGEDKSGKKAVAWKCEKLIGARTYSEILRRCQECGQRERDKARRKQGKPPLCPIYSFYDNFMDVVDVPEEGAFDDIIPEMPPDWTTTLRHTTMEDVKRYIEAYNRPIVTNYDLYRPYEEWLRNDPLGRQVRSIRDTFNSLALLIHNIAYYHQGTTEVVF